MNSTIDCYEYLQPDTDIVGIGMRVSVYVQCFSCIALLLFPTAHELVKSSFRTSLLTMYAIGFSFFFAHHTGSYSLQSILVAHCFVDILLLSAFSLMCFRPSLQSRKHYVILIGGIPFAIWTLVQAAGRHTACYDSLLSKTISVDSHTFQLYKSFWAISAIVYTLSLPLLFLISFPRLVARLQPGAGWLAVLSWLLATVSTVAVSEITMATVVFKSSDNQLASLQSSEWTFGQVFAVVMLFFVVWDIALYPLECSNESEGSRLQHWWNTKFKPSHPRLVKFFGINPMGPDDSAYQKTMKSEVLDSHMSPRLTGPAGATKDETIIQTSDIEKQFQDAHL